MSGAVFWVLAGLLCVFALAVVTASNLYRAAYALAGVLLTTALLPGLEIPLSRMLKS